MSSAPARRRHGSLRRAATVSVRPCSIARVGAPPALDTSIHVVDTLFRQRCHDDDDDGSGGGASPTSLAPTGRASFDSDDTLPCDPPAGGPPKDDALLLSRLMDALFPMPLPGAEPYHAYYVVATLDGRPAIPDRYACPTALCDGGFARFEELQRHWPTHPWNRRGVLLPVAAGGIRRLTFWQHKAAYLRSLLCGPPHPCAEPHQRRRWLRLGPAGPGALPPASDYGDIRLFGPSSYFVSPRVVPIERVRAWEEARRAPASSALPPP
ncbi:hypothetical protein H4R18_004111 [Coemansia javaensis]|uniref:C2H2-type domain-containing protein n=1 Tax=Coemansia javaensis TaxID=2761396 RepID=A0A9W8LHL8_9FUNG|nr:hypothetical protein H4R18_004111 [Coemansia javaensis]